MRIAITGASGLIGRALAPLLLSRGHQVFPLRRGAGENAWDVSSGEIRIAGGFDALVHLAGRNVAARWSARVKREIFESRVTATAKLASFLAALPPAQRPATLISASAVGIYGDRGDELLTEESPIEERPGISFLADVCRGWEAATAPAAQAGIRVVHARIGVVLAKDGGALAKLATPTKLGLAGPVGRGTQFLPWVALPDAAAMLAAALEDSAFHGPMNIVAGAERQHAFIRTLGHVLHRPTVFPMPAIVVKTLFGQMGAEVLLGSQRAVCTRKPAGFSFAHTSLESAIRTALAR